MVRFKNRYIVFEITPHNKEDKPLLLKASAIQQAIQRKVQQLYGDFGLAAIRAGLNAKYCNAHTKIALVRARHGPHKFLLHTIPLINDIGERYVKTNILYIGATMKHCFFFIRKHQEKKLEQIWMSLQTKSEREKMEKTLMTLMPAVKDFT